MLPLTLTDVIVRRRGKRLLGPVSHVLGGTGVTAVIGPNGAGKTTLLRVMHGIERLSSGATHWAVETEAAQAQQSYVFQTPILLRRSVMANLQYPLHLRGVTKQAQRAAARDWAAKIGLSDHLTLPANRLSGGERQKLAVARALITDPQVLFLDEPSANLDGHATREIEALIAETAAAGTRVVLATHDMGQVRRLASNVIFLVGGQIVETGTELMNQPQTPELQAFLRGDIVT